MGLWLSFPKILAFLWCYSLSLALISGAFVMAFTILFASLMGLSMNQITSEPFGKIGDTVVNRHTLKNKNGVVVKIMDYGAIITDWIVSDAKGNKIDIALGFDTLEDYLKGHPYFGSNAGRVGNRIAKATFKLEGKTYQLAKNNGPNALHGGLKGFDKVLWKATPVEGKTAILFKYKSPDGEEGYPGNLDVSITYTLEEDNGLKLEFSATTDKATPINLAHHSYFNLNGHSSGDILGHTIRLSADNYTPVDETLIPIGKIETVKGTPLDFTTPQKIGARFNELKGEPTGYDHNFVVNRPEGDKTLKVAAVVRADSGLQLRVLSTEPGVQFYTGNFLDGTNKGKGGAVYKKHGGFCLEPQHFPDSINQPNFPTVVLHPGETYSQTTIFRVTTIPMR